MSNLYSPDFTRNHDTYSPMYLQGKSFQKLIRHIKLHTTRNQLLSSTAIPCWFPLARFLTLHFDQTGLQLLSDQQNVWLGISSKYNTNTLPLGVACILHFCTPSPIPTPESGQASQHHTFPPSPVLLLACSRACGVVCWERRAWTCVAVVAGFGYLLARYPSYMHTHIPCRLDR